MTSGTARPPRPPLRPRGADRWDRLAADLGGAVDARARRDLLVELAVPVPGVRLASLLARVPVGWQQRMVLRNLLAGPGIHGQVPTAVLEVLGRDADRFAVAARLDRAGLADRDELAAVLPDRQAARLLGRRAAVRS